jgi:hypothetical protein
MKKWGPVMCGTTYENTIITSQKPEQQNQQSSFPSLSKMASNFTTAASLELKSIALGQKDLSAEEVERRYSLCEACEFFHAPSKRCKKCGCYLKWKTAWRSQKCPIGKW